MDGATDPAKNPALKAAIKAAKKAMIPDTYTNRILQYARQGFTSIEFPTYDTDWDSEAYISVSGQNSNNSVRVTDAFLKAVKNDQPWELIRRTDGKVAKTVSARELWDQIGHAAWACADPGIQFHDTVNAWHTCPEDGAIRGSNPCSEYMFLDDTACNLASMNLLTFFTGRQVRRRGLCPRLAPLDGDAGNLRDDGAVPLARKSPSCPTTSAPSASATPTSAAF